MIDKKYKINKKNKKRKEKKKKKIEYRIYVGKNFIKYLKIHLFYNVN